MKSHELLILGLFVLSETAGVNLGYERHNLYEFSVVFYLNVCDLNGVSLFDPTRISWDEILLSVHRID